MNTDSTTSSSDEIMNTDSTTSNFGGDTGEYRIAADGDDMAASVLEDVASLVSADRDTHGDAVVNQRHIAEAWTWYLRGHGLLSPDQEVEGSDVAQMMTLLKMSRGAVGEMDVDHLRDSAGYSAIAAACSVVEGDTDEDDLTRDD